MRHGDKTTVVCLKIIICVQEWQRNNICVSDFQQSGLAAMFGFQTGDSARYFASKGGAHIAIGTHGVMMMMAILRAESHWEGVGFTVIYRWTKEESRGIFSHHLRFSTNPCLPFWQLPPISFPYGLPVLIHFTYLHFLSPRQVPFLTPFLVSSFLFPHLLPSPAAQIFPTAATKEKKLTLPVYLQAGRRLFSCLGDAACIVWSAPRDPRNRSLRSQSTWIPRGFTYGNLATRRYTWSWQNYFKEEHRCLKTWK